MQPPRRIPPLTIAIPASYAADIPHLREKTSRIGIIARAAATFRADEIVIYRDQLHRDQRQEIMLIATLLRYIETPQYLRRLIYPTTPLLRYAGVLPPLRTPHHPLERHSMNLKAGQFREGVVIGNRTGGVDVEIGVEKPAFLPQRYMTGTRLTLQVIEASRKDLRVRRTELSEISIYWGYRVSNSNPTLGELVKNGFFDLLVATSRLGKPLTEAIGDITARWRDAQNALITFGSPQEGLDSILAQEGLDVDGAYDFVLNTIPFQGVETIRTEEAIWATLASLNIVI